MIFSRAADFSEASFLAGVSFSNCVFDGTASFRGANFGGTRFETTRFSSKCTFSNAQFWNRTQFIDTLFDSEADFDSATYWSMTAFFSPVFSSVANFSESIFHQRTDFWRARFDDDALFSLSWFVGLADFSGSTFARTAHFNQALFEDRADFSNVTFKLESQFGPTVVIGELSLDNAVFDERITIETSAGTMSLRDARFPAGGHIRLRWSDLIMANVDILSPLVVSSLEEVPWFEEERGTFRAWRLVLLMWCGRTPTPPAVRLSSVEHANVAGLVLYGTDLTDCRFRGTINLDRLQLEGPIKFRETPMSLRFGMALLPVWFWTRRVVIAEECEWRRAQRKRSGWSEPASTEESRMLQTQEIASVYRSLRKGREESKNEPGAADFYYGEMEMRRKTTSRRRSQAASSVALAERFILWWYWLLSGYGLRASRTFVALAMVLGMSVTFLANSGLADQRLAHASLGLRFGEASVVSVESAMFRDTRTDLTFRGRVVRDVLRFTGPVLLGLAIVSIRGRVKR